MRVVYLSSERRDEWDELVSQSPTFALLQSWEWGRLKESRGWRALRVAVEESNRLAAGAQVLVRSLPLGLGSVAYVPCGPVGDWLSGEFAVMLLDELKKIACKNGVLFLRIEPAILHDLAVGHMLNRFGFVSSKFTNQPRATLVLDLTPDLSEILAQMKRVARSRIRYAECCGVTVCPGEEKDLPFFYELMQATGERGGFLPRTYDYYEQQWRAFSHRGEAVMLLAFHKEQLLGARMSFRFANRAAGLHACSRLEYSELRANWLLVWEEIKWAKLSGCRTLDLWGIPDEVGEAVHAGKEIPKTGPGGELWGVYQFKRGFTQNVVYYAGAYDYVQAPLLYVPVMHILSNRYLDRLAAVIDFARRKANRR
ncbi:MAG: peptidoglycan bridge formation glycyltransferase FemA/FemB family protein [Anaerolineae bacterium]|nr:peptidoglycan bridge formation glycyltransferase FemA/FemB family protein [Anaerolineae bacterium]